MTKQTKALKMAISYIKGGKAWVHLQDEVLAACEEALQNQEPLKFELDELTEEYIAELDDKTVLIISGGNRKAWTNKLYTSPKEWQELSDDEVNDVFSIGYCAKHYQRLRRNGVIASGTKPRGTAEERFWRFVEKKSKSRI